jgi:hypothetical protein
VGYRWLVTAVLAMHFAYLAYVVAGGFLMLRWPRAFWPHLVAAAWGLAVVAVPLNCPLTALENWARGQAGEAPATTGFIDRYITNVIYPERYTTLVDVLVAIVVAVSWALGYRHWRAVRRDPVPARTGGAPAGRESEDPTGHTSTL